jgi:hypothetical protein
MSNPRPHWLPAAVVGVAAVSLIAYGPIAQFPDYHDFADRRMLLGIPNADDVLSNVGFAVIGVWGLARLLPRRSHPNLAPGWPGWFVFLASLVLTALGSGWYHLAPDDARLIWDRLPIALGCAGILTGVRAETATRSHAWLVTIVLCVAAIVSVVWWNVTEDLRPYLLLQASPLVLIPLWQWIYNSPRADRIAFATAILLYVAAKLSELADHPVLSATGVMSGHTIKHLLATAAAAVVVARLIRRSSGPP